MYLLALRLKALSKEQLQMEQAVLWGMVWGEGRQAGGGEPGSGLAEVGSVN